MKKTHSITEPILSAASRLEAIANRFIFIPMGTTAASMKILRLLEKRGPLMPRRILELSGGTKSNVSQRLAHLEKNGYIVRDQDVFPDDLRKVLVKLTAKGKKRLDSISERMSKAQLCLASHFSEKEIESHCKFFEKINAIIDKEEENLDKIFIKAKI